MSEPGAIATGFLIVNKHRMWNDTETPLAYLITFRTYGTWLHGDIRGSIDRNHNKYGSPKFTHTPVRKDYVRSILKRDPVLLNGPMRIAVKRAIEECCYKRRWTLKAENVRTNHAHVVVATGDLEPNKVLVAFKANSTRHMREAKCWISELTPWAVKGSIRYLWNEDSVGRAIWYVFNEQGEDLPDFL